MTITKLETKAIKIWNKNLIVPHSYNENHRITYETAAILHHNCFMSIDELLCQMILKYLYCQMMIVIKITLKQLYIRIIYKCRAALT